MVKQSDRHIGDTDYSEANLNVENCSMASIPSEENPEMVQENAAGRYQQSLYRSTGSIIGYFKATKSLTGTPGMDAQELSRRGMHWDNSRTGMESKNGEGVYPYPKVQCELPKLGCTSFVQGVAKR